MPAFYYLGVGALLGLAVNDWLMVRRVQRAIELGRLHLPGFEPSPLTGTPLGIVVHLVRLRGLPEPGTMTDPDVAAVRLQYRVQICLAVLFALCLGLLALRRLAA